MPSYTVCTRPILGISITPTSTIGVGAYGSAGAGSGRGSTFNFVTVRFRVVGVDFLVVGVVVVINGESSVLRRSPSPRVTAAVVTAAASTMANAVPSAIHRFLVILVPTQATHSPSSAS